MAGRKTKRLLALTAAIAGVLSIKAGKTFAQTEYWDNDTSTSGEQDGPGEWDLLNSNWLDPTLTTQSGWTQGANAVFGGTIGGTVSVEGSYSGGWVTLGTNITAGTITFNQPGYDIIGGSNNVSSQYSLNLTGGSVVVTGADAINAPISGSGFTVSGNGSLGLGSLTNTFSGNIQVESGATLGITGAGALGAATNGVILDGGTLSLGITTTLVTNPITMTTNGGTLAMPQAQRSAYSYYFTGSNVLLGGAGGTLTKTGYGTLYIEAPQAMQGTLVMANDSGLINIEGSANGAAGAFTNNNLTIVLGVDDILGVDNFDTAQAGLYQGPGEGGVSSTNRVASGIQIQMNDSQLSFTANDATANTQIFGTVTLSSGFNRFNVTTEGDAAKMVISNLVVNPGTEFYVNTSTYGVSNAANGTYLVINQVNGVNTPVGFLGGWAGSAGDFLYNAGGTIGIQSYGGASGYGPAYTTTLGSSNVSTFATGVSVPSGTTNVVGAIKITGATVANAAITFANGTSVLDIQSGGILYQGNGAIQCNIGSSATPGIITVGGGSTAAFNSNTLYIKENNSGNINIYSQIVDNGTNPTSVMLDNYDISGDNILLLNGNNSYTGGTYMVRYPSATYAYNWAAVAGSLSSGNVYLDNALLYYTTGAHNFSGTTAVFVTNAGFLEFTSGTNANVEESLTNAGDRFYIGTNSEIVEGVGSNQAFQSLTRVANIASATGAGVIQFAAGAEVRMYQSNTAAAMPASWTTNSTNGTNGADLWLVPLDNAPQAFGAVTMGTGTPWEGFSADDVTSEQWGTGTITANSNITWRAAPQNNHGADGDSLVIGTSSYFNNFGIVNNAGHPITINIQGTVELIEVSGNMNNTINFDANPGSLFELDGDTMFGTSSSPSNNASLTIESGAFVESVAASDMFNGSVYIQGGGSLEAFQGGNDNLTGIGTIHIAAGGMLYILGPNSLQGGEPIVSAPGAIFELLSSAVVGISNTNIVGPSPIYELEGGSIAITNQVNPETINLAAMGSIIANDYQSRTLIAGNAPIIMYQNGLSGTIAATTGTLFGIENYLDFGGTTTAYTFTPPPAYVASNPKTGGIIGLFTPFNASTNGITFTLSGQAVAVGYNNNGLTQQSVPHNTSFVTTAGGGDLVMAYPETEVIAGLSGNGNVYDTGITTSSAGTFDIGSGNVSSTFAGSFINNVNDTSSAVISVNITKIGTGTLNLTGGIASSNSAGTFIVGQGIVDISGTGNIGFGTDLLATGGTLTLDNSGTTTSNRLGSGKTLDMSGGTLSVIGGSGNAVETIGTLTDAVSTSGGASVINYTAGSGNVIFNVTTLGAISGIPTGSILINDNVGGAASNSGGAFNIYATTPNLQNGSATNTGTTYTGVRPDIIVNNGGTLRFATYDSTYGLRALNSNEMASYNLSTIQGVVTGTNGVTSDNMLLGTSQNITGDAITMSLTLNSGANITGSSSSEIRLGVRSGGILVQNGNSTISTPWIDTYGNSDLMLYTAGNLTINSYITDAYGIEKSGTGTLSLGSGAISAMAGALAINQGATVLGANDSVPFDFWAATGRAFYINGGSLDLKGNNEVMYGLYSNAYPGMGGLLTNSSTTGAVVTLDGTTSTAFGGTVDGNIELDKAGSSTFTITAPQTYTGLTYVRQGTLTLRDSGSVTNSAGIIVQGNSTFLVENNQSLSDLPNRTGNVPITIASGTLQVNGGAGAVATGANFSTVNINAGVAVINSVAADYSTNTVTIGNLNVNANGVVDFKGNSDNVLLGYGPGSTNGGVNGGATMTVNTPLIQITQMNGTSMSNFGGFMGGWAVVNDNDFAYYSGTSNGGYGVGAYGENNYGTYASFLSSGYITSLTGAQNVFSGGAFVGALKMAGATTFTFQGTNSDVLNIESGGLLGDNTSTLRTIGAAGGGTNIAGSLSAGSANPSGPTTLYAIVNSGTITINSQIIDNTNGAGASLTLVKALAGNVILGNSNTFTGGTIVEGGTLFLDATNSANSTNFAAIPGALQIVGTGIVTESAGKQLSPNTAITFNEGGTINIFQASTETITSVTFDGGNGGGPALNIGTNVSATTLTLSGSNAVTVTADNVSDAGHINNGVLTFTSTTPIINVGGTAILGLQIGSTIDSAHEIVKTGTGGLYLAPGSASSAWTSGLDIQQGLVAVNNISAINAGNFYQVDAGAELSLETTGASVGTVILNGGTLFGGGTAANATNTVGTLNVSSNGGTVQLYNGANPAAANNLSASITTLGGLTGGTNAVLTLTGPAIANLGSTLVVTGNSTYTGTINVDPDAQLQLLGHTGLPSMAASIDLIGGSETNIPGSYGTNLAAILKLNDDAAGSTGATVTFNDSVTMSGTYVNITADRASTSTANTLALAQVTIGNQYVTAAMADSYNLKFNNAIFTGTGTATLNVLADTLTLSNATTTVSTGTLVMNGPGTLTMTTPQSFTLGDFVVNSGVVNINGGTMATAALLNSSTFNLNGGSANLGVVTGSGTMTVSPVSGTMVTTVTKIQQSALTVNAGGYLGVASNMVQYTNSISTLTLNGSGQMDLANNTLYTTTSSNTIRQYLINGYNGGAWNGTGGISSINANASYNIPASNGGHFTALGYSSGTTIAALGLTPSQTVVKYTIYGDANLDGNVDISDLDIVLSNFLEQQAAGGTQLPSWDTGDFYYTGQTDISDLDAVLSNFFDSAPTTVRAANAAAKFKASTASTAKTLTGTVSPADTVSPPPANGVLELVVNTTSGDVELEGNNADIASLQITSASSSIITANWTDLHANGYTNWSDTAKKKTGIGEYDNQFTATGDYAVLGVVDYGDIYNTTVNAEDYVFKYGSVESNDTTVDTDTGSVIYVQPVPEPTTLGLMGLAAAGLMGRRRKSKQPR